MVASEVTSAKSGGHARFNMRDSCLLPENVFLKSEPVSTHGSNTRNELEFAQSISSRIIVRKSKEAHSLRRKPL
jgi:hypothetical protein